MTARTEIVATITDVIEELTTLRIAPDVVLQGHEGLDSLDALEIGMAVEEEFGIYADLDPEAGWTIDKIADVVIAAKAART